MKLTKKWFIRLLLIILLLIWSGCVTVPPYTPPEEASPIEEKGSQEKKTVIEKKAPLEEKVVRRDVRIQKAPLSRTEVVEEKYTNEVPSQPEEKVDIQVTRDTTDGSSNQELIDSALDYIQASNDFWEQGDLDNAVDALDKAYSLTLQVDGGKDPEVLQQKEDLRFTISKRIIEVYSSRFTVANGSHKAIPLDMNRHVQNALDLLKGRERKFFLAAYARSGVYRPAIVKALREAGLPEELSWLPLIESGYKVRALSRARALGMWQFIASTGYKYGLKRDPWIDERMDPAKSTKAAIGYLTELHQIFGDWTTVLASYNCGERRVLKYIKAQKINYLDNFWDLYERLPRETAFYVPKFLAVLHILNNPKAHGFDLPPLKKEVEFEEVTINKQVHLKTIAKGLDTAYDDLTKLNPELRRNLTPKRPYSLKVPTGKGEVLLAKLDDIPAWRAPVPTNIIHRVRKGETLSVIANRYKTSVNAIMKMNGLRKKNYLKVGWKLKIPAGRDYSQQEISIPKHTSPPKGKLLEYVVRKGDSLWKIANRYKTTVNTIRSLNRLQNSDLKIGQVILISEGIAASEPEATKKYRVRRGDSPYLIAKKHQMNLYEFLKLNRLTPKSTIFPGQIVKVSP